MTDIKRELVGLPVAKKFRGVISSTVIWREIKDGTFPVPVVVNGRRYWFKDELVDWQKKLPRMKRGLTRTPDKAPWRGSAVGEAMAREIKPELLRGNSNEEYKRHSEEYKRHSSEKN